ncbi:MAG TPA: class I SAM-dependent methyltransferase [Micromonosporaceae bacterium]|nr:class I SAM-dependent methyltransferase [Micromonosporaceae bacterium]
MSPTGTAAHLAWGDLPPAVAKAVDLARRLDFANSCLPPHGELLRLLARGVGAGVIGETGTGCGVGLAWLATGADPGARLVSIERDAERAAAAALLFEDDPRVRVCHGDWRELAAYARFDLLVLDGGGTGKRGAGHHEPPLDPLAWVRPGGLIVIDDFTPSVGWPPTHDGSVDTVRLFWLEHPHLRSAQLMLAPDAATIVATVVG